MPTFSFPVAAPAPAPAPEPALSTANKPAKGTARKKKSNIEDTVTAANANIPDEPVVEVPDSVTNEDDSHHEPTFPDVIILKQTDKNYIVKHNTYALANQEPNKHNETKTGTGTWTGTGTGTGTRTESGPSVIAGAKTAIITQQAISSGELVSPNQIYKGQISKKRGRKPKAGFILNSATGMYDTSEVPNIILHLKCHLSDLKTNDSISNFDYSPSISEVESYNLSTNMLRSSDITHSYISDTNEHMEQDDIESMITTEPMMNDTTQVSSMLMNTKHSHPTPTTVTATMKTMAAMATIPIPTPTPTPTVLTTHKKNATEASLHIINERHQKEIMKKINRLKYSFHNGETIQMKLNHKCACFWDTCEFDGPIYYTPIMIVNGVFHVSGCYCSPECALASLLKEQMDTSTKFERIHLLHLLYGTSNSTGFKPAPNPNYLLDKYYGNLTIDEFRSLLKGPQMIHVVNKPLTHILPELYEDNNDFLVNSKVIPTNTLKLKKRYKTMLVQGSNGSVVD